MSRGLKNWEEDRNELNKLAPSPEILGYFRNVTNIFPICQSNCVDQIEDTNQLSKYNRFTNCSPNLFQTPTSCTHLPSS
jgi:hypothetical protein